MGKPPYCKKKMLEKNDGVNVGKSYKEYLQEAKEKNPKLYAPYNFRRFNKTNQLIIKGEQYEYFTKKTIPPRTNR